MTLLVRYFSLLYRWLSASCLPYHYFIILVRFIENVLHFHFRLKIQTRHFVVLLGLALALREFVKRAFHRSQKKQNRK